MTPDKVNGNVEYYDKEHVYIDKEDKEKYISVTTLIHSYQNEFDADFWTSYKALEFMLGVDGFKDIKKVLLTTKKFDNKLIWKFRLNEEEFINKKAEILKGYDEERDKSCERGTGIHSVLENEYYKKSKHDLKKYGLGGDFTCKKDYFDLDLEKGIYPEYLVYRKSADGILRVAGQIDLLIKDGNDLFLFDHKTNKEMKHKSYYNPNTKKYECLKYPLNNIMDCNVMHYTLQLSTYAYLLQSINPEFNIKILKLLHINHDNVLKEIEVEYLKDDVERMFKHYKKQLIMKTQLAKDLPMKF